MTLKVTIDDKVLQALPARTERIIGLFLDAEAEQTVNDIKLSIQMMSFGRRYMRRGGIVHIASRPGAAPNIDTGTLIGDYTWKPQGTNTRLIYTSVEYAPMLEFGTERMAPRPHVGPAIERTRARLPRDAARFRLVK